MPQSITKYFPIHLIIGDLNSKVLLVQGVSPATIRRRNSALVISQFPPTGQPCMSVSLVATNSVKVPDRPWRRPTSGFISASSNRLKWSITPAVAGDLKADTTALQNPPRNTRLGPNRNPEIDLAHIRISGVGSYLQIRYIAGPWSRRDSAIHYEGTISVQERHSPESICESGQHTASTLITLSLYKTRPVLLATLFLSTDNC